MSRSSWVGTMPNTAAQVAELQTSFFDLGREKNISYYYDTALRLKALQATVLQSEKEFFSKFDVSGIEEIQKRLDLLNTDMGFRSMVNLPDTEFDNIVTAAFNRIDPDKPMEFIVEDNTPLQEALISHAGEMSVEVLIELLNQNLKSDIISAPKIRNYKSGSKDSRGLGSYLGEVTITSIKKNEVKVEITPKHKDGAFKALTRPWQNRLAQNYGLLLTNINIFEMLKQRVLSLIQYEELKQCVAYQFDKNADKYDLNDSKASIKGFLGEVHAAAALDYLFKGKGDVIPTGKIKNYQNREIPIDIIVEEFGFQVKNYRVIDGLFKVIRREGDAMGAANFVTERLKPSGSLSDIMIDFFGSYQFNQPVEDATERYKQIYSRFSQNKEISEIFNGYLDNILKVSEEFRSENLPFFKEQKLYFNTFFIIGDKIVPSSRILQAIIETLNGYDDRPNSIESRFWISTPSGGIVWKKDKTLTGAPVTDLANSVKINWIIELNISEILDKAVREVI